MSLTDDFAALFEGRKDAYGMEEGGARRVCEAGPHCDHAALWLAEVQDHLNGEPTGVYPMVPREFGGLSPDHPMNVPAARQWFVKWGCVDLDVAKPGADYATEAEAHDAALNIQAALESFGITSWIERTRSGGRHVWVFAEEWVPAHVMRRALLVACNMVGESTREVNPKQESLPEASSLGNYVRLPYPGGDEVLAVVAPWATAKRIVFHSDGEAVLSVDRFVDVALRTRNDAQTLADAAALYVPPTTVKPVLSRETRDAIRAMHDVSEITPKLGGLAYTVWRDGPLDGGDRSTTLARLAHLCREDGLTPDEAFAILESADLEWGKFFQRRDGVRQLEKMIERAYAGFDDPE